MLAYIYIYVLIYRNRNIYICALHVDRPEDMPPNNKGSLELKGIFVFFVLLCTV